MVVESRALNCGALRERDDDDDVDDMVSSH